MRLRRESPKLRVDVRDCQAGGKKRKLYASTEKMKVNASTRLPATYDLYASRVARAIGVMSETYIV